LQYVANVKANFLDKGRSYVCTPASSGKADGSLPLGNANGRAIFAA